MQLSPQLKAQIETQKAQCVYCKIIKGEIPAKIVHQDSHVIALLDIYPAVKGHTVLLLKEHYPSYNLIPEEELYHLAALFPSLTKAIKNALVKTSMNIFIANGGVAGQYFPHFAVHLLPREEDDKFFHFLFKRKTSTPENMASMLQGAMRQILPHKTASFYEDDDLIASIPPKGLCPGHIEIRSKKEPKFLENLSSTEVNHLFHVAFAASSVLFDGLRAQGTNIILKSGFTDDNPSGELCLHVFPRFPDDALADLHWQPTPTKDDLDVLAGKIKDKTWNIKVEKPLVKKQDVKASPPILIVQTSPSHPTQEIQEAIARVRGK